MGKDQSYLTECLLTERHLKHNRGIYERLLTDKEYVALVKDILEHETFRSMSRYIQHGTTTTLEHCLSVSYYSYKICRFLRLDGQSAARAGLLHDFYLYDWHTRFRETGERFHGLFHPRTAMNNAKKYFPLTKKECNIVLRHMFPLTPIPPKSVEGFVVVLVDKYCGLLETMEGVSFQNPRPPVACNPSSILRISKR